MMRGKLASLLVLSMAILLIPSSLRAGGKEENVIRCICIRPASAVPTYCLKEKSTNLVSLGSTLLAPIKVLSPQERAELERNFLIVRGVRHNTRTSNKQK